MFQINTTSFLKCCHLINNIELGLATPAQAWWTAHFFLCNFMQRSSRSWVRSKVKVKAWVQHSVDSSLPFHVNLASHSWVMAFSTFGLVNQRSRSNDHNIAQLQVQTIPQNFKWHYKSIQQFQRYGFRKVWPKCCLIWQVFGPWASPYGANNYDAAQLQV